MITYMFSVQDLAVGAFLPPFFARSVGEAVRSFGEACRNAEHQFFKHKDDYTLFALGSFDDNSGVVTPAEPRRICGAREVIGDDDLFPPEKKVV